MALTLPYIDRIWRARGEVLLDEPLSAEEAFARLDPLFQTPGTTYAVEGDTLAYKKRNPAAQDKLATFTSGTLQIEQSKGGVRLRFHVASRALLLTFLAPLLFLGFAQAMVTVNAWEKAAETEQSGKAEEGKDKPKATPELHPLDQWLGAPAPEDPAKKKKEKKDKGKFDPTAAYVLAGLFFAIWMVGRVLEPWLLKRTLRAALAARDEPSAAASPTGFAAPQPDAG